MLGLFGTGGKGGPETVRYLVLQTEGGSVIHNVLKL